jgi:hypothetical protein
MTDWRSRWMATAASNVSSRDGIGWEFSDFHQRDVWSIFREDGGDFPVFSAARGEGPLPLRQELEAMTLEAVAGLLAAIDVPDQVGWLTKNVTAALLVAAAEVDSWEGLEWAIESGENDVALAWAQPSDGRTPFAWLRGHGADHDVAIDIYQDNGVFGLSFLPFIDRHLPESDEGSLRSRREVPVVSGRINKVEVVLDTLVEGGAASGLVTEVLLHGDSSSTLLIAAEAYARDEWHLYDESVVVVPDVAVADALAWIPPRRQWRPTETSGR